MVILTLADYGLKAERSQKGKPEFAGCSTRLPEKSIVPVGIRASRWGKTMHGFALERKPIGLF